MTLALAITLFAAVANSAIGIFVAVNNIYQRINRYFALLSFALSAWIIINYLSVHTTDPNLTLFWMRGVMVAAVFQVLYFFLLVDNFARNQLYPTGKRFFGLVSAALGVSIIAYTPLLFSSVHLTENGSYSPTVAPGIVVFLLYAVGTVATGLWILIRKYLTMRGMRRSQLGLLLLGVSIMFTLIILFNLILPLLFNMTGGVMLSPLFTMIFIGCTAYAIITQHLFDIRVVIKRTFIFSVLLAFILSVYTTVLLIFSALLGSQHSFQFSNFLPNLITIIIVVLTYPYLRRELENRTNLWLYKKQYEQQEIMKELSQSLNGVIGLDEALEVVMQTIAKALHPQHIIMYVFQSADGGEIAIKRIKQIGYAATARLLLEEKDFTMQFFTEHPKVTPVDELTLELEEERILIERHRLPSAAKERGHFIHNHAVKSAVLKKLTSLDVTVAIPLRLQNQPIGLILLGDKLAGDEYGHQDIALLELIGGQAISSIQKAKLYEGDVMKTEFVSIASHELLTPISAIEGYLSMILDEKIGGKNLDPQTHDYLNKCFASAKRLSMLVKDLLSVSRIESGKMKIEQQKLDIAKSIQDTLDQLRFVAAEKKVTLVFSPSETLPPVWADSDRTAQVLVNLVSNAIKYNHPEGTVTVATSLKKREHVISISVTDTGIGMNHQQMSHLFEKFYRVDSPDTVGIIGTGLGLYITKSIVERMGGTIAVKSDAGQGTTFIFTLPLFRVEMVPEEAPTRTAQ